MDDHVWRNQRSRKSCGGPPSSGVYHVGGYKGRRWCGGGQSSVSRKRPRSSPEPPPLPRRRRTSWRYYSDNDDEDDDGNHGRDDDDDREEDEQQSGNIDERGSSRDDVFSSGSDADADDVAGEGVAEEQPAAEEEDSDDERRPISFVSRARTLLHQGSSTTAPPAAAPEPSPTAPAPPEPSPAHPEPSPPSPAHPEPSPPAPAPPEPSPPSSSFSDSSSVIRNMMVENSSVFDCSICYLPLKSPIFQCTVGHVVCSPCHDKLGQATNCHVCRIPIPDGYFRCNAMEQVVDSIRVRCPHAAHGCAERLALYHDRDAHAATCAHKPCHCPADGCGFTGSVQATLLEHFTAVHGWHCSAGTTTGIVTCGFDVSLRKGFNIVVVTDGATRSPTAKQQYTVVLNVEQAARVCYAITAFSIHPSKTGTIRLELFFRSSTYVHVARIKVVCTDLSNGMPDLSSCPPFLLPRWSAHGGEDDEDIRVRVTNIGNI